MTVLALTHATRNPTRQPAQLVATLPVAALWIATGTLALHLAPAPDPQLTLRPFTDNLSRTVIGHVVRARPLPPRPATNTADAEHTWEPTDPENETPTAEQVDLALTSAEYLTPDLSTQVPVAGGIRLTLFTTPVHPTLPDLHCGDLVQLPVRLRLPERYHDPGAWQYADYLLAQGISAHGSARADQLELLPATAAPSLHCRLLAAQTWAANRLSQLVASTPNRHLPRALRLSPDDAGMLAAMLVGIAIPLGEHTLFPWLGALHRLPETRLDQSLPPRRAQLRLTLRLFAATLPRPLAILFLALLRLAAAALELLLIAIVAELIMALPMAVYFHRATLFALPANLLSLPLIGILLPSAILTFAAALLSPWLAILPGALTAALLHLITSGIGTLSRVPLADARVPPPSAAIIALALIAWAFCCWAARRSRPWALATAIVLPLVTLALLWPEPALLTPGALELTAIDVGQGDSLLVVGAEGRTMLVDAGGPTGGLTEAAQATAAFDVGEEVVAPYLWSRRIRRLDTLVLSHAHSDHMGGMPAILRDLRPRELWVSLPAHADAFDQLLVQAHATGTTIRFLHAGQSFPWGAEQIDVLAPTPTYTNPGTPKNDDSLVLRVTLGKASILLEGDAEAPSERAMLASGQLSPVTLLKVGHHGSLTSTTPDFLAAVAPADAVISTGLGNHFGHPRPEILTRLAAAHARTFRTDEFGLTTFLLTRDGRITSRTGDAISTPNTP